MLSYQHAYHAGGPADVHKHFALAELISLLTKKARGISYLETHAGRGLYDLSSEETAKTGEAAEGIARIPDLRCTAFRDALAAAKERGGEDAYPGSPLIAAALMRQQDRVVLLEKHPQEHGALKRALRGWPAEVHHRDGYEGAIALTPLEPRRGLVLIDPSYEVKSEYEAAGKLAARLHARWPEAAIMVWYPLLAAGRHTELLRFIGDALVDEVTFDLKGGKGMTGSGLAILGAPYGAEEALERAFTAGQLILKKKDIAKASPAER